MTAAPGPDPLVVAVVLGYNHADDTVACLHSLRRSTWPRQALLYVDNGSRPDERRQVLEAVPEAQVLAFRDNVGVGHGFNAGIRHGLRAGAEYIFITNNDTIVDPAAIGHLVAEARQTPRAGLVVPKVFYHSHPDTLWSAGSRFRRFPPAIVMQKTSQPDDGRYDAQPELQFATLCSALLTREMLAAVGVLDPAYWVYMEDYDLCLRTRAAGFRIRLACPARVWHKVSMATKTGTRTPNSLQIQGRAAALFFRKHRGHGWLTGWAHSAYIQARIRVEDGRAGFRAYRAGWREGQAAPLAPPPRWDDPPPVSPDLLR